VVPALAQVETAHKTGSARLKLGTRARHPLEVYHQKKQVDKAPVTPESFCFCAFTAMKNQVYHQLPLDTPPTASLTKPQLG
jgi:hypothetical protein